MNIIADRKTSIQLLGGKADGESVLRLDNFLKDFNKVKITRVNSTTVILNIPDIKEIK